MRRPRLAITAAVIAIAGGVAALVWWLVQPSYDDMVKDCQKALSSAATKTDRPEACDGLSQEDYDTLLAGWVVQHTLDEMPKGDRDLLDYSDDGEINGSIG